MRELDELLIHFSDCHINLSPRDYFFRHHDWEREEKEIEGAGADTSIAEETTSAAPAAPEEEEDASEDFSEGDGHPTKSPSLQGRWRGRRRNVTRRKATAEMANKNVPRCRQNLSPISPKLLATCALSSAPSVTRYLTRGLG